MQRHLNSGRHPLEFCSNTGLTYLSARLLMQSTACVPILHCLTRAVYGYMYQGPEHRVLV